MPEKYSVLLGITPYLHGSGNYTQLPVMQKISFASVTLLVLGLEYFTRKEDFDHSKKTVHGEQGEISDQN